MRLSGFSTGSGNGYHRLFKALCLLFTGGCREPRGRGKGLPSYEICIYGARYATLYEKRTYEGGGALYRQAWRLLETLDAALWRLRNASAAGVLVMTGQRRRRMIFISWGSDVCNVSGLAARRRIGVFYGEEDKPALIAICCGTRAAGRCGRSRAGYSAYTVQKRAGRFKLSWTPRKGHVPARTGGGD